MADGTAITSNATEEISSSYLIAANTVSVGDFLEMFARAERTVDNSVTYTVNVYSNTSASLAGANLLLTYTTDATARDIADIGRFFIVKSSTVTQGLSNTQSTLLRYVIPTAAFTETNIDWTVDQYVIIALTNNGAGQTVLAKGMLILKY
jgi:hypothetical protein